MFGKILSGEKKVKPTSYTLELKCADGFSEYQSYETKEEAGRAGENQLGGFIVDYSVKPFYCNLEFWRFW